MSRLRVLTIAAVALVAAAAPAAEGAPVGTISGVTRVQVGPQAKAAPARIFAIRLIPKGDQTATFAKANRRFSFKASPGVWAVVTTTAAKKGVRRSARIVRVRANRTSKVPTPKSLAAEGAGAGVAVGTIVGPNGAPDPGIRSMLITDVVNEADRAPCDYEVRIDPKDPDYQAILRELRTQATEYFPPATRAAAQKALKELGARAPQYRLEGTVTKLGESHRGASSGTFRLVQAATGSVLWEETVSLQDGGSLDFLDLLSKALSRAICDIPVGFTGTGQATTDSVLGGLHYEWSGQVAFALATGGGAQPNGTFEVRYNLVEMSVGSSTLTFPPTSNCSALTGTWAGTPATFGGVLRLIVHPDGSRTYDMVTGLTPPGITVSGVCGTMQVSFPGFTGSGLISNKDQPWLGPTLAGTYSGPWPRPDVGGGVAQASMTGSWVLTPIRDK